MSKKNTIKDDIDVNFQELYKHREDMHHIISFFNECDPGQIHPQTMADINKRLGSILQDVSLLQNKPNTSSANSKLKSIAEIIRIARANLSIAKDFLDPYSSRKKQPKKYHEALIKFQENLSELMVRLNTV